jgi:hypothetical protein
MSEGGRRRMNMMERKEGRKWMDGWVVGECGKVVEWVWGLGIRLCLCGVGFEPCG